MSDSANSSIAAAQIAVFAALSLPAFYCLIRHGASGFLGWIEVFSFCTVRVIGAALQYHDLHNHTVSTATQIVTNLGLTPLILAAAGILHEARWIFGPKDPTRRSARWLNWFLIIQYHSLVIVGIVLIVSQATALESIIGPSGKQGNAADSSDVTLVKVGFGILLASWIILCIWTAASYRRRAGSEHRMVELGRKGVPLEAGLVVTKKQSQLLHAVTITLPLIGLPVIYSAVCYIGEEYSAISSIPLKVCFSVVPQMLITIIWVMGGLRTRDLRQLGLKL